jgi:hypothetical protein
MSMSVKPASASCPAHFSVGCSQFVRLTRGSTWPSNTGSRPRDELGVVAVLGDTPLVAGDQRSHVLRAAFDVFGDVEFGDRQHADAFVGRDGLE